MLSAEVYLSFMVLICLIVFLGAFLNGFVVSLIVFKSLALAALASVAVGFSASAVSFGVLYIYPSMSAGKKRREIDVSLPYAVNFMGILSSAGVPPDRIFRTLAVLEQKRQVGLGGEAQTIYRDMEALGEDMISVLKGVADRKISLFFSGLMEGIISTIRSGGDLTSFLREEGKSLMRMRRSIMKEFLDTMTMVSEMFMAIMVAFPLIMIVMLVVMSSIGGGSIGGSSPDTLVPIIIYGLVPAAGLAVLILVDTITPR